MIGARHGRLSGVLCLTILLPMVTGCGHRVPQRAAVAGSVTFDGRPLEQGSILFVPVEGVQGIAAGGRIEHGQYRLSATDGPMAGRHRVEIRAARKTGKMVRTSTVLRNETAAEIVELIPPRFNSASTLRVDIKPGDNTADFAVESK